MKNDINDTYSIVITGESYATWRGKLDPQTAEQIAKICDELQRDDKYAPRMSIYNESEARRKENERMAPKMNAMKNWMRPEPKYKTSMQIAFEKAKAIKTVE